MTAFIVLAALLALAAIALIIRPLLKPAPVEGEPAPRPDRPSAIVLAVAIPALSAVLYSVWSNWPWDPAAQISEAAADPHGAMGEAGSMEQVTRQLEERLVANPEDVDGWKILGRTYVVTGNYPKARDAYSKAVELTQRKDWDAVLGFAEASVLVDEQEFAGEAGRMFEEAYAAQPDNPKAQWYAGLIAYRKENWQAARERWVKLASQDVPPNIKTLLDERIAELDGKLGKAPATPAAAAPAMAATPPAAEPAAADGGQKIRLRVELAPALKPLVKPDTTLFVLGRPAAGGPPVAVVRRTAGELPFDLTLSDQNVMTEGMSIAAFGELTLVARVSLTGMPQARAGDLFGELKYDFKSDKPVTLTIDRVVP